MIVALGSKFFILGAIASLVLGQNNSDIAAAIEEAVRNVSARRSTGVDQARIAATGIDLSDSASNTTSIEARGLAGVSESRTIAGPDDAVRLRALFGARNEAPGIAGAQGAAAEIAATATEIFAARNGGATPDTNEFIRLIEPYCPQRMSICDSKAPYRTSDGSCNNLFFTLRGVSFAAQARFIPPAYGDPANTGSLPRIRSITGIRLPSARVVSNAVHDGGVSPPRSYIYNVALTHFGQFIDHDIISTPIQRGNAGEIIYCCNGDIPVFREECFSFRTPPGDFRFQCMEFTRSDLGVHPGCPPGPRDQLNQRTSYLDLSVTYGNTDYQVKKLRAVGTGKLKTSVLGNILPNNGECREGQTCFDSGDHRSAEIPMLTVFHIMFLREHNSIVDSLKAVGWNDDELLFQESRKILTGIYQHIIYNEFLPTVLGEEGMNIFGLKSTYWGFNTQYNPAVDATTRNAFGAAAYRFGHSLVGSLVGSSNIDFSLVATEPLEGHFFNPTLIRDFNFFGPDGIGRWMSVQPQSQSDRFLTPSVRNKLFEIDPKEGFDLAALNIQRGRDHGLPSYNRYRMFCGLPPAFHFGTGPGGLVDHDYSAAEALRSVYSHPEDIDLFAGGLSERLAPDALVGPTFRCLIGLQFMWYKTGDRFFYENNFYETGFTLAQLQQIKSQTMAALYCRQLNIQSVPWNAFRAPIQGSNHDERIACSGFKGLDFEAWRRIDSQEPYFQKSFNTSDEHS